MNQVCHNMVGLASYRYLAARRYGKHQTKQRGKQSIASNTLGIAAPVEA
jgi:hypothetical protein